jgi:hypothetical protein
MACRETALLKLSDLLVWTKKFWEGTYWYGQKNWGRDFEFVQYTPVSSEVRMEQRFSANRSPNIAAWQVKFN